MGLVSTQFTVIASASAAGVISTNNRRWAVINNVQQTLTGAERSAGVAAFADVAILDDEDYADEMAKDNGRVAVIWLGDSEFDASDSSGNRVTVIDLLISVYARKNSDALGHKADVLSELSARFRELSLSFSYTSTPTWCISGRRSESTATPLPGRMAFMRPLQPMRWEVKPPVGGGPARKSWRASSRTRLRMSIWRRRRPRTRRAYWHAR